MSVCVTAVVSIGSCLIPEDSEFISIGSTLVISEGISLPNLLPSLPLSGKELLLFENTISRLES